VAGWEVVLSAPDYREEKVKPDNRASFRRIVDPCRVRPLAPFLTSGREAYLAAGEEVLMSVDRLMAVWDSGPSGGLGGTVDVVEHARQLGTPVEVIGRTAPNVPDPWYGWRSRAPAEGGGARSRPPDERRAPPTHAD
jgi:hypothetical protein